MDSNPELTKRLLEEAERDIGAWLARKVAERYAGVPQVKGEGGLKAPQRPPVPMRYVLKPETLARLKALGVEPPHG